MSRRKSIKQCDGCDILRLQNEALNTRIDQLSAAIKSAMTNGCQTDKDHNEMMKTMRLELSVAQSESVAMKLEQDILRNRIVELEMQLNTTRLYQQVAESTCEDLSRENRSMRARSCLVVGQLLPNHKISSLSPDVVSAIEGIIAEESSGSDEGIDEDSIYDEIGAATVRENTAKRRSQLESIKDQDEPAPCVQTLGPEGREAQTAIEPPWETGTPVSTEATPPSSRESAASAGTEVTSEVTPAETLVEGELTAGAVETPALSLELDTKPDPTPPQTPTQNLKPVLAPKPKPKPKPSQTPPPTPPQTPTNWNKPAPSQLSQVPEADEVFVAASSTDTSQGKDADASETSKSFMARAGSIDTMVDLLRSAMKDASCNCGCLTPMENTVTGLVQLKDSVEKLRDQLVDLQEQLKELRIKASRPPPPPPAPPPPPPPPLLPLEIQRSKQRRPSAATTVEDENLMIRLKNELKERLEKRQKNLRPTETKRSVPVEKQQDCSDSGTDLQLRKMMANIRSRLSVYHQSGEAKDGLGVEKSAG